MAVLATLQSQPSDSSALLVPTDETDATLSTLDDDLASLLKQGPGASKTYSGLSSSESEALCRRAESDALCCQTRHDGSLVVYVPGDEMVYGVVPYGFEELGLHEDLVLALLNWEPEPLEQATHIQAASIPKLVDGDDLVIQAETGSGKTLAYLLPAAHRALQRADAKRADTNPPQLDDDDDEDEDEDLDSMEKPTAGCYRVEAPAGAAGLRPIVRPDEFAPRARFTLRVGDEFMASSITGSPLTMQFVEMADGRGWVPWDRQNIRYRFSLSVAEFRVGQRVIARDRLTYGSGDVVEPGTEGTVVRVLPLVGVSWSGLAGVKAVDKPRRALMNRPEATNKNRWARYAPDTLIFTLTQELCLQVADVARKLGRLLPEHARDEWTVATAIGPAPGVNEKQKGREAQWPFPSNAGSPKILVTTPDFMNYYTRTKHMPLWANIHTVVYDEADLMVSGLFRVPVAKTKGIFRYTERTFDHHVQTIMVSSCMPSQGGGSARSRLSFWMPEALRALPRPDWLHRGHPMVLQKWKQVPVDFEGKLENLLDYLTNDVGVTTSKGSGGPEQLFLSEKTVIFCKLRDTAARLAEILASTYNFQNVGLFVPNIGIEERVERMNMFRDGRIRLMVCTDVLSRGIDIPDLSRVVQFELSRNIVDHIARIGRVSRAGSRGEAMNFYDETKDGGFLLAQEIQDIGDGRLDALFSRRRGLRDARKSRERFKNWLISEGLPLPKHLQDPKPVPLLSEVLEGVEDVEEIEEAEDESGSGGEKPKLQAAQPSIFDAEDDELPPEKDTAGRAG